MGAIHAFGQLAVLDDGGEPRALGGPRQQAVLAVLVAARGMPASADRLIDEVWGDRAPSAARQSLQSYVSNLRRVLDGVGAIDGGGSGYRLRVVGDLDIERFDTLVAGARAQADADSVAAAGQLHTALTLAGGRPFDGVDDVASVEAERARLVVAVVDAAETRAELLIATGAGGEVVEELQAQVARHPLRERLWAALMVALYRGGRQAEALRAYEDARKLLLEELGIDPSPELRRLEQRLLDQDPTLMPGTLTGTGTERCPYKGLAAYQPEDAAVFFGRAVLVERVVTDLEASHLVAVVGASGSGKSSLLRAGVVAALARQERGPVLLMTPGSRPVAQLAERLASVLGHSIDELGRRLESDPGALVALVTALGDRERRLVLVVDQLEELFTLCADDGERRCFAGLVACAARRPDARVLVALGLRADFYGRFSELAGLRDLLTRHHVLLGPMGESELRSIIIDPAAHSGLQVEPALVDTIVADAGTQPGALPLISHALVETWHRRDGSLLTRAGYLEAGGVHGALARTADDVVGRQMAAEQRSVARTVLTRLVRTDDAAPDTSRPQRFDDLRLAAGPGTDGVVEILAEARLLTVDGDIVSLAHEALLSAWPTLRMWLDEDRHDLAVLRRVEEAAAEWERAGHDPQALYGGNRLTEAEHLLTVDAGVAERERAFLSAALDRRRRQARRRRSAIVVLVALVVVTTIASAVAVVNARRARDEQTAAERASRQATSRTLAAQSVAALRNNDQALAALLGVAGERMSPTVEASSALAASLLASVGQATVFPGHEGDVRAVAVNGDGTTLVSGGLDGTVRLWHPQSNATAQVLTGHRGEVFGVALADEIVVSAGADGTLRTWSLDGEPLSTIQMTTTTNPPVTPLPTSPGSDGGDGGTGDGPATDPSETTAAPSTSTGAGRGSGGGGGGGGGGGITWTPLPLTGGHVDGAIAPGAHQDLASSPVRDVDVTARGTAVAVSDDGVIRIVDLTERAITRSWVSGEEQLRTTAFSPDSTELATAGRSGNVQIWDLNGNKVADLPGHTDAAFALAWSPDGRRLASVGRDRSLRVWEVATRQATTVPNAHDQEIYAVAFNADGTEIITGSADRIIRRWRADTLDPVDELTGHTAEVRSIA